MTKLSDVSEDLVGEILSRVPSSSLIPVRSTCKPWNAFSKKQILGQKAMKKKKKQFQQFMVFDSRVCSLKIDLQGIRDQEDEFINPCTKQVSIFNEIEVKQVSHCDGLLLCVTKDEDNPRVMVRNPYLGQVRWIKPLNKFHIRDEFALGFDNKGHRKILRFDYERGRTVHVYDFTSDSWSVLDIRRPESEEFLFRGGMSLKGNAYFFDKQVTTVEAAVIDIVDYLVCFDFTTERFGPRLPLPFNPPYASFQTLTLSSVRDEKLSVLYQHEASFHIMDIWVSTKIELDEVSWSKFLSVDMSLISGLPDDFEVRRFFIDGEKKVAVLFNRAPYTPPFKTIACIIGEDGYFKSVDIGESGNRSNDGLHVCSSYVPSLVEL